MERLNLIFKEVQENYSYFLQGVGFINTADLVNSLFHIFNYTYLRVVTFVTAILTFLGMFLEKNLELTPLAYLSFLLLCIAEFATGLAASLRKGKKWNSRRFNRMLIKIGIYSLLIFVTVQIKNNNDNDPLNIFGIVYYVLWNGTLVSLVISVLENLNRLGFKETSLLIKILNKYLGKWFDFDGKDNDDKNFNDDERNNS